MSKAWNDLMSVPLMRSTANLLLRLLKRFLSIIYGLIALWMVLVTLFGQMPLWEAILMWIFFGGFVVGTQWLLANGPRLLLANTQPTSSDEHGTSPDADPTAGAERDEEERQALIQPREREDR